MSKTALVVLSLCIATGVRADWSDCDNKADRRIAAALSGVSRVSVIGRAGKLQVTGRPGVREVVATGTACSDDKSFLNEIQLRAERNGSELRIEAVIPERNSLFGGWNQQARLDFEVVVPEGIETDVRDGSGEARIENVGKLRVIDGSGSLHIRGVRGDVDVEDGSGEVVIENVSGSVNVEDGSGSIEVRNVQHNVTIDDGSGSIDVLDVRGDFIVRDDGSGGIDYDRVAGRVQIPRRR